MSGWLVNLLICHCIQQCLFYKIQIQSCITPYGIQGFCRIVEDCVGYPDSLTSSGCPSRSICCPRRSVSQNMCYQYGEAVYSHGSGALNLMADFQPATRDDECAIIAVPLIVGGEKVVPKEFPHMAALGFGPSPFNARWMCGGSLISEQFVLTAAHCLDSSTHGRPKFVKLGVVNVLTDRNNNLQIHEIQRIIIHPRFMKEVKVNDIALLKLSRNVRLTPFVRPACLDYTGLIRETKALATGWGKLLHENTMESPDLMKVMLDIIDRPQCSSNLRYVLRGRSLQDSQICAGVMAGGKDTCQGDSGGPLQTIRREPYCMYSVVGVTSYGSVCGYAMSPAIYTRVFSFVPWIESIVWPGQN